MAAPLEAWKHPWLRIAMPYRTALRQGMALLLAVDVDSELAFLLGRFFCFRGIEKQSGIWLPFLFFLVFYQPGTVYAFVGQVSTVRNVL